MKIIESISVWDFWALLKETRRKVMQAAKQRGISQEDKEYIIERELVAFIDKLPNSDYLNIKQEFIKKRG